MSTRRRKVGTPPATCEEVVALLTEYMEGSLAGDRSLEVERHLAGCRACAEYLASLRTTRAAVRGLRRESIPPEVTARLRAYLERNGAVPGTPRC